MTEIKEVFAGGCMASVLAESTHVAFALMRMRRNGSRITPKMYAELEAVCEHALKFCGIEPTGDILDSQGYLPTIEAKGEEFRIRYEKETSLASPED